MTEALRPGILFRIKPPVWAAGFLALGLTLHYTLPDLRVPVGGSPALAGVLGVASFGIAAWAIGLFRLRRTDVVPGGTVRVLVQDGPYRFTRNPMYLGLLGALLSFAVGYGTWPLWLAPPALFVVLRTVFIPYEERLMEEQFRDAYRAYRARVRRWL